MAQAPAVRYFGRVVDWIRLVGFPTQLGPSVGSLSLFNCWLLPGCLAAWLLLPTNQPDHSRFPNSEASVEVLIMIGQRAS
ncbi:hypothetical protein BJY01DRAFT_247928 [Aspergillus pseudoustus]|uniref:Uncharacterized protein n=1 Tax=Aspergillus pseudoustus TaxID=1810923 RepID=A0ABR4JY63_9EURO